jgi:hypothetical protein
MFRGIVYIQTHELALPFRYIDAKGTRLFSLCPQEQGAEAFSPPKVHQLIVNK